MPDGDHARPTFGEEVDRVLRALRPGDVVTYGEVAAEAGFAGAARAVGSFLAASGGAYAWWRVVRADGRLAPGKERAQARLLTKEGVAVDERTWRVRVHP